MDHLILIILAMVGLLAFFSQWLAWKLKIPAILFLLIFGILIGPTFHLINPNTLFGDLLVPMIKVAVAIILFEGSLTLHFNEWKEVASVVRNLVTIGSLFTALLSGYFMYVIFQLPITVCALFGAIICVSGPTVIVPLLRIVRPQQRIANILRWEGILIDPIGAILAALTLGIIAAIHDGDTASHISFHFIETIVIASILGVSAAYWLGKAISQRWIPEYLHNIATLTIVIAAYTVSNLVDEGSGLLCVTIMGIFMTNMPNVNVDDILDFKENLSIMLISGVFIIIAADVSFDTLHLIFLPSLLLFLALQFIVRPLSVFICTLSSQLAIKEKILLAWICPRGIVAAAVAPLFAYRLNNLGIPGSHRLVLITFLMIIYTVVFQSLTSGLLARLLKVSEPEPKGFLIYGANAIGRLLAKAINAHGYRSIVADTDWHNISKARMSGLNAFYGNPTSEHADRHLDLVGIGNMAAVTPEPDLNALAVLRYRNEFGRDHVFSVQTQQASDHKNAKHAIAERFRGLPLFDTGVTYSKLAALIKTGSTLKTTQLTKSFDFQAFCQANNNLALPLFGIDTKGIIHFFLRDERPTPKIGWLIISLSFSND